MQTVQRVGRVAVVSVALTCGVAFGAERQPSSLEEGFLSQELLAAETTRLPPPPRPGAADHARDTASFLATRDLVGTPRWGAAVRDNDLEHGGAMSGLSCALGRPLSASGTPATWRLLQGVETDIRQAARAAKRRYWRDRPPVGNTLPICIPRTARLLADSSYPSGHAMLGAAWGEALAQAAPERGPRLRRAGLDIGDSRAICGVHYPSDVAAGQRLGLRVAARLTQSASYQAALAQSRAELTRLARAAPTAQAESCVAHNPPP